MRHSPRLIGRPAVALIALTAILAAWGALTVAIATAPASAQATGCRTARDKTGAPQTVQLGDPVTVTLSVSGDCPDIEKKADVVLVIDRSGSMAGQRGSSAPSKLDAAKDAAAEFVDVVDVSLVQIAVIAFDAQPEVLEGFSVDRAVLRLAVASIQIRTGGGSGRGGTNIVDALDRAHDVVTGPGSRPDAGPVIVFLTDGQHTVTTPPLQDIDQVIDAVRADDVTVYAIGLGGDADRWLLRRMAGRESRYYHSPTTDELIGVYREIAMRVEATVLFDSIAVTDVLPVNMEYVPASAAPAAFYDTATRTLSWTLSDVLESGSRITYRVTPQELGTHPTNVVATGDYTDGLGFTGRITFPVPQVTVVGASAPGDCVCRVTRQKVPSSAIDWALVNPERVRGWNLLLDPGKPGAPPYPTPGYDRPPNSRRTCLDLQNRAIRYHPTYNSVVWRAGCLEGPNRP